MAEDVVKKWRELAIREIRRGTLLICLSLFQFVGLTQNDTIPGDPFTALEVMPEFPGGETAMTKYFTENLRYPSIARENGIEGMVVIQFVVDTSGNIQDATVSQSVHKLLDEEALRLVWNMPDWKPGTLNGKKVKVQYNMPIRFFFEEPLEISVGELKIEDFQNLKRFDMSFFVGGRFLKGNVSNYFSNTITGGLTASFATENMLYGFAGTFGGHQLSQAIVLKDHEWEMDRKFQFINWKLYTGWRAFETKVFQLAPIVGAGLTLMNPSKEFDTDPGGNNNFSSFEITLGLQIDFNFRFETIPGSEPFYRTNLIRIRPSWTSYNFGGDAKGSYLSVSLGWGLAAYRRNFKSNHY